MVEHSAHCRWGWGLSFSLFLFLLYNIGSVLIKAGISGNSFRSDYILLLSICRFPTTPRCAAFSDEHNIPRLSSSREN